MLNRNHTMLHRAKKTFIVFLAVLMIFQVFQPGLHVLADTDIDAGSVDIQIETEANVLAASTSRFNRNTGTDRRNNRVGQTATIGMSAMNLLQNAGMENTTMAPWTTFGSGASVSTNASYARIGTRSQQAVNTPDGGFSQAVTLQANTTYTFSAYVNTSEVRQFTATGGIILFFNRNGVTTQQTVPFNIRTDSGVNDGWHRLHVTYTPGATALYLVGITYRGITDGTAHADNFQLEIGTGPSNVNLVQNSAFQMTAPGNLTQSSNRVAVPTGTATLIYIPSNPRHPPPPQSRAESGIPATTRQRCLKR